MSRKWGKILPEFTKGFIRDTFFVSGVYALMNKRAKKIYVGESDNVGNRVFGHLKSIFDGNHHVDDMNKDLVHGIEFFHPVLLKEIEDDKERVHSEHIITKKILNENKGYTLYSAFHAVIRHDGTPTIGRRHILTEDQIKHVIALRQDGYSCAKIAKVCNALWGFDYSYGRYHQISKWTPGDASTYK